MRMDAFSYEGKAANYFKFYEISCHWIGKLLLPFWPSAPGCGQEHSGRIHNIEGAGINLFHLNVKTSRWSFLQLRWQRIRESYIEGIVTNVHQYKTINDF